MKDFLSKFLKGQSKESISKEHKKCIYCGKDVYTTNIGICSRKQCIRTFQDKPLDKHGKYLQSCRSKNAKTSN
jgi:hypothetical protein